MKKLLFIILVSYLLIIFPVSGADILGDSNNSNMVDIIDALLTAQYYVGLQPTQFVPGNSDVNSQNGIDIVDALLIAQHYVGLISEFPGAGPAKPALSQFYTVYNNTITPDTTGYSLPLDTGIITNYADMDTRFDLEPVNNLISENGFVVMEYNFPKPDNIFSAYESISGTIPTIITTDILLHLYLDVWQFYSFSFL